MRRLLLLLIFLIPAVARAQQTVFVPLCAGSNDTARFTALAASAAGNPRTIQIPYKAAASRCASNTITLPANLTVDFTNGGITLLAGQTITIQGPIIAPPKQIFFGTGTVSFSGNKVVTNFYPEWWGAVGNNSTNDQPALQAATDAMDTGAGGTLHLGNATYRITSTWNVGTSSSQHYINIVGPGPVVSMITYAGATNSIAIKLNTEKFTKLEGFALNSAVARGTTEGIRASGPVFGTNTNGFIVERVSISGFHYGWRTSDGAGSTSSEGTFIDTHFFLNDTGFLNDDLNGLNFVFINSAISSNTIGIDAQTAGIFVYGGAAAANNLDFKFQNGGVNVLNGFRSENVVTYFVHQSNQASVSITACQTATATPNSHVLIKAFSGVHLTVQDSYISGQIEFDAFSAEGFLSLRNSHIIDPSNTYSSTATPDGMGPGFRAVFNGGASGARFESIGNTQYNNDFNTRVGFWPSGMGIMLTNAAATNSIAVFRESGIGAGAALTVSGNAIAPTSLIHAVGAGLIKTITVPTGMSVGVFYAVPTAAFTTDATGNISKASTAVVGQIMVFMWDGTKWNPSY